MKNKLICLIVTTVLAYSLFFIGCTPAYRKENLTVKKTISEKIQDSVETKEKVPVPVEKDTEKSSKKSGQGRFKNYKPTAIDLLNDGTRPLDVSKNKIINENSLITPSKIEENDISGNKKQGFRVQILSTKDPKEAKRLKAEIRNKMKDHIYVIFEAPLFKIRIGDFLSKENAQESAKAITKLGYKAEIINSSIWTK